MYLAITTQDNMSVVLVFELSGDEGDETITPEPKHQLHMPDGREVDGGMAMNFSTDCVYLAVSLKTSFVAVFEVATESIRWMRPLNPNNNMIFGLAYRLGLNELIVSSARQTSFVSGETGDIRRTIEGALKVVNPQGDKVLVKLWLEDDILEYAAEDDTYCKSFHHPGSIAVNAVFNFSSTYVVGVTRLLGTTDESIVVWDEATAEVSFCYGNKYLNGWRTRLGCCIDPECFVLVGQPTSGNQDESIIVCLNIATGNELSVKRVGTASSFISDVRTNQVCALESNTAAVMDITSLTTVARVETRDDIFKACFKTPLVTILM
jgi:hypothetical protein